MMDFLRVGKDFLNQNINVSIHNPEIIYYQKKETYEATSSDEFDEKTCSEATSSDEFDEKTCSEATSSDEFDEKTCSEATSYETCNDIQNEFVIENINLVYNRPFTEIQHIVDYNLFLDNVENVSAHKFFKDNDRDDFCSACFLVIRESITNILHVYIQHEESKKVYEIRLQVEKNSIQVLSFITNDYALKKKHSTIDVNILNKRNILLPDTMIVKKYAYDFLVCRVFLECKNEKNARSFFFNNEINKEYLWLFAMFNWWNRLDCFYID